MTIISFCFYGFLRLSECLSLTPENVIMEENRIIIILEQSKTNQTGKKEEIFIHNSESNYSPFKWLPIYQQLPVIHGRYLFPITSYQFRAFF